MARKKKALVETPTEDQSSALRGETHEELTVDAEEQVNGLAGLQDVPFGTIPEPRWHPAAAPVAPVAAAKERITCVLNERGGLDLDGMREGTKARLVAALRKSSGDLFPKAPELPVKRWPDIAVRAIYSFLGAAEAGIAARKYPMEVAVAAFTYTDEDMKELMEPTQAVLLKYAGKLDRFQEETTLVLAVAQVHFAKMHALREFMTQWEAKQNAAKATPGPRPDGTTSVGLQ